MLSLSRRGSDAVTLREFDIDAKAFARESFVLPEAKSEAEWIDPDTLVLSSSYGRDMATTSGYARTVRLWRRGTVADQATVIFDIAADHGSARCNVDHTVAPARSTRPASAGQHPRPSRWSPAKLSGSNGGL
ncbi:prolyl oligopeptidase PreP (S9A serine peptidase family) [Bradyrhizobium sp. LB14.3]